MAEIAFSMCANVQFHTHSEPVSMNTSRRDFFRTCGILGTTAFVARALGEAAAASRTFHFSTACTALETDPELLENVANAGVTDLWLTGSWTGKWLGEPKQIRACSERIAKRGLRAHVINVPLGHPGTGPEKWLPGILPDGTRFTGTSLHPPATEENCDAVRQLQAAGVDQVFLDDDFRLASSPGVIGGCFCPDHKQEFLRKTGFGEPQWNELLDAVKTRRLTSTMRAWVDFTCDQLTACFRAQQKAAPGVRLGIMVMYLGSEKAGIRLRDYAGLPMRVGELMFDDGGFNRVKGKTDELFSSLFHRRFVAPELAFSETTAYPEGRLSLANKIAKLAVSTISDVRNTMFMCDFPKNDWPQISPFIRHHAKIHSVLAGHKPRGPLKHYWGEASRYVGNDDPYSLFLGLGIPFEVSDDPAPGGFTFLSDSDARMAGTLPTSGTTFVGRPQPGLCEKVRAIPESLPDLINFKQELLPQLGNVPYVEGDIPIVCAWYPTARAVLLWNLGEKQQDVTLRWGESRRTVSIKGLDVALIGGVDAA
jgi:hypothetical protein